MASQKSTLLSPIDQLQPRSYIPIALIFPVQDHSATISRLQDGLAKTCTQLPYVKGRVFEQTHESNKLAISWTADSPTPVIEEKLAPEGFPNYADLKSRGAPIELFPYSLFPQTGSQPEKTEAGAPVFGVSCVKIVGGLVVAIAMHHCVMDGTGLGEFVKIWAKNTMGEADAGMDVLDHEEPLNRKARIMESLSDAAKASEKDTLENLLERHPEYALMSKASKPSAATTNPPPPASSKLFTFSGPKLTALKTSLANTVDPSYLTTNNILCAVIWSHITYIRTTRSAHPETSQVSKLGFPVNKRRALSLESPPYLGNILLFAGSSLPVSAMQPSSPSNHDMIAPVVSAIADTTRKIDKAHIGELTRLPDLLPDLSDVGPGFDLVNGPDLSITSWANLGLYDANFGEGVGKPDVVRVPYVGLDGMNIILPRRREGMKEEVIEVVVMLREDDMERLGKCESWQSWLEETKI